ncbi:hypothetical protein D6B98_21060 [Bradyrhizobium sp. LVM 105]|uniref:Uncharacterized protein n=1 Tax=Bradyrhizobium frederickii TaxID=2560054 RepID=A0A4Y9KW28_9BRAD|nr:hypothetical protein D6B98_21060 [Bradyrhizobium sp. LVM 105]TFV35530.1 hypothetical protein E4K66_26870 [Bradyrhizobium frederickii]
MRGEVGLHRRCNPGEGDSPRVQLSPSPRRLPLTPAPRKRGEGGHLHRGVGGARIDCGSTYGTPSSSR